LNKIYEDFTYEQYANEDGVRSSQVKAMDRSMAHYKHLLSAPTKDTDALSFGRSFHMALLEPELYEATHRIEPVFEGFTKDGRLSTRSGAAQEMKKAWYADLPSGAQVISNEDAEKIKCMVKDVREHELVGRMIEGAKREASLFWEEDGVVCKARYDMITKDGVGVDFKTTDDAKHDSFLRQIFSDRLKYYLSASHYAAGGASTKLLRGDIFCFVAVEKDAVNGKHRLSVIEMQHYGLAPGNARRKQLFELYKSCKLVDKWPAYDIEARVAVPPAYMFPEEYGG